MKNFSIKSILLVLMLGIAFNSCETTELELLDDPNNLTTDKGDLERFVNAIQLDFSNFIHNIGDNASEVTRIEYMFGRTYVNNYQPADRIICQQVDDRILKSLIQTASPPHRPVPDSVRHRSPLHSYSYVPAPLRPSHTPFPSAPSSRPYAAVDTASIWVQEPVLPQRPWPQPA